jgi:hypothetical protein
LQPVSGTGVPSPRFAARNRSLDKRPDPQNAPHPLFAHTPINMLIIVLVDPKRGVDSSYNGRWRNPK